jgi:hypothetical protein
MRRATLVLALITLAGILTGCSDTEDVLDDEDASRLVEQVLADLELPGEPELATNIPAIPEGELEFGFHCHIQSAGFEIDEALVAFPPARVGHHEIAGGPIERVEVALLVFDTAATASAVLAAYDAPETIDCLSRTFSEAIQLETDDPLEAGGVTAEGFAFTIGEGGIQREGHRTFAAVVGRTLVDVTVLAPDESRGREMAEEVLGDIVNALEAGGA